MTKGISGEVKSCWTACTGGCLHREALDVASNAVGFVCLANI